MSSGGSPGGPGGGGNAANASAASDAPQGRNVGMGNGSCGSWPARGRSGKTLDAQLVSYVAKITDEHAWSRSNEFKTAESRFPGLEGSQLTDVCIYFYALGENATYKVARRKRGEGPDGPKVYFLELLTKRHRLNMTRKNHKGRIRYKKLFARGGYQADIVGKMVGVQWVGP